MKLLRAATVTVSDLNRSKDLYSRYFDYSVVEEGTISDALAASWGTPKSAGQPYVVMQPSSGAEIYIRFVEQPAVKMVEHVGPSLAQSQQGRADELVDLGL